MTRHIDQTHSSRITFRCPQCPALYKHAFHFADHLRAHENEPQFPCGVCEKRFHSRNQLRSHHRRNCEDPKLLKRSVSRKSGHYEPQVKVLSFDTPNSIGKFHIPYDFAVTL
ncbi:zinc finger, C2H2 type [Dictyocaulus viviparus]|uniref:Zinc finger, C2H2 type n=1 Tax=Dictyocaulus viviparus TaxID=29172 RepID=A0A0D8XU58_DICVI|nr:zinc finger, C2H2 type [Dictyocaulus viviparus]